MPPPVFTQLCSFAQSVLLWSCASLCPGPAVVEPSGRGLTSPIWWTKMNPYSHSCFLRDFVTEINNEHSFKVIYNKANECIWCTTYTWEEMSFLLTHHSLAKSMKCLWCVIFKHTNGDLQSKMLMWPFPHSDRKKLVQLWLGGGCCCCWLTFGVCGE